jgi:YD repeat-containing protein
VDERGTDSKLSCEGFQTLTATDRNGNVHTLTYDVLGRLTSDAVTTLGVYLTPDMIATRNEKPRQLRPIASGPTSVGGQYHSPDSRGRVGLQSVFRHNSGHILLSTAGG